MRVIGESQLSSRCPTCHNRGISLLFRIFFAPFTKTRQITCESCKARTFVKWRFRGAKAIALFLPVLSLFPFAPVLERLPNGRLAFYSLIPAMIALVLLLPTVVEDPSRDPLVSPHSDWQE